MTAPKKQTGKSSPKQGDTHAPAHARPRTRAKGAQTGSQALTGPNKVTADGRPVRSVDEIMEELTANPGAIDEYGLTCSNWQACGLVRKIARDYEGEETEAVDKLRAQIEALKRVLYTYARYKEGSPNYVTLINKLKGEEAAAYEAIREERKEYTMEGMSIDEWVYPITSRSWEVWKKEYAAAQSAKLLRYCEEKHK